MLTETMRRRGLQQQYNEQHGIIPTTIKKDIRDILEISSRETVEGETQKRKRMSEKDRQALIAKLTAEMKNAAKILEFEHAAYLRDKIKALKEGK